MRRTFVQGALLALYCALASSCMGSARIADARQAEWVAILATSQQVAPTSDAPALNQQTLRLIVRPSAASETLRVRLANTFGSKALLVGGVTIAIQEEGARVQLGSTVRVTFAGRGSVVIPAGAPMLSDPVAFRASPDQSVAVSVFLPSETGAVSAHPGANQISYVSGTGDFTQSIEASPFKTEIPSWPLLASIEAQPAKSVRTVVAFGDSITDGYKSTVSANRRWPDYFAARLRAARINLAVVNQGISGNRVLHDALAMQPRFGVNALARFDRDVLAVPGASHVVVLIGINDIGMGARNPAEAVSADDIIAGLRQLALRARAKGLKVIGATLLPFRGAGYFTEDGEAKRARVNEWLRSSRDFDGLLDFDRATRDPAHPSQLLAAYDSGDHLHPNDAGYEAMANSIDLSLFE